MLIKAHDNWSRIDWEISENHSPRVIWIQHICGDQRLAPLRLVRLFGFPETEEWTPPRTVSPTLSSPSFSSTLAYLWSSQRAVLAPAESATRPRPSRSVWEVHSEYYVKTNNKERTRVLRSQSSYYLPSPRRGYRDRQRIESRRGRSVNIATTQSRYTTLVTTRRWIDHAHFWFEVHRSPNMTQYWWPRRWNEQATFWSDSQTTSISKLLNKG